MSEQLPISQNLLDILRDPIAVQEPDKYGPDPGRLELVHNCWLVSKDTGYKYPISEGIPVMLPEEGLKWKDTPVEDLPVPPPALIPKVEAPPAEVSFNEATGGGLHPLVYVLLGLVAVGLLVIIIQYLRGQSQAA